MPGSAALAPGHASADRLAEEGVRAQFGNIGTLEGLRGVAVLWVVMFHYLVVRDAKFADPWIELIKAAKPIHTIVGNGYLGVDLFFLITGFLLMLPWWRRSLQGGPAPSARDFYRRRALRIVPAYYVQLAILFVVVLPLLLGPAYWRRDIEYVAYNVAAHLTFLHYTTPISSASMSVNGALWTLTLEFQYYLLLPLLAPLIVRAPWRSTLALVAVAAAWRWLAAHDLERLVALESALGFGRIPEETIRHLLTTQLPGYFAHFAAGILAGRAWFAWHERAAQRAETVAWLTLAALSLALLYWLYAGGNALLGECGWLISVAAMAVAMLALVSRGLPLARPLLANAPLAFTGRVSYSMYLYHLPLLLLWNRYVPSGNWASLPAYLAALTAVAWLSYRFIERRFIVSRGNASQPRGPR